MDGDIQPHTGCSELIAASLWAVGGEVEAAGRDRMRKLTEDRGTTMASPWKQQLVLILQILVSCRHINTMTAGPTPEPFVPVAPLETNKTGAILEGEHLAVTVELVKPVNMTLECTWTGSQNKPANITAHWGKDGEEIPDSRVTVELKKEQYNLSRVFEIVSDENLGNYSCVFENEARIDFILRVPQIGEKRDKPIVSYLDDSVVMTCKMEETKPKPKTWNWYKSNGTDKEQIVVAGRYKIINDDWKTKLKVQKVSFADSGQYYCGAVYPIGTSMSKVGLKVISIMEPLKPFIAILIESLVLVVVILLYEWKRAKKNDAEVMLTTAERKTAEPLEDKEEGSSSVRQRKA